MMEGVGRRLILVALALALFAWAIAQGPTDRATCPAPHLASWCDVCGVRTQPIDEGGAWPDPMLDR